ncbi:MAG TPA: hypothetical protein VK935_17220 [Actinomycetospora sp.]|nr:hypothetical protein [Actinomycetospora sp.]
MEPTPIFAALVAPPPGAVADEADVADEAGVAAYDGHGEQRRTVPEILRALRAEREPAPPVARGRVGHVPGVLSFPARG